MGHRALLLGERLRGEDDVGRAWRTRSRTSRRDHRAGSGARHAQLVRQLADRVGVDEQECIELVLEQALSDLLDARRPARWRARVPPRRTADLTQPAPLDQRGNRSARAVGEALSASAICASAASARSPSTPGPGARPRRSPSCRGGARRPAARRPRRARLPGRRRPRAPPARPGRAAWRVAGAPRRLVERGGALGGDRHQAPPWRIALRRRRSRIGITFSGSTPRIRIDSARSRSETAAPSPGADRPRRAPA